MSSLARQLHTVLRMRAEAEHRRWSLHYVHSGAADRPSSRESRGIFPRYLMQQALLEAVERVDVATLVGVGEARERLIDALQTASNPMTDNVANDPIASAAMNEEKASMLAFARDVREEELEVIEELPYRHIVTEDVGQARWNALVSHWGIDPEDWYWYPLSGDDRADLYAFDAGYFHRFVRGERLWSVVRDLGAARVWEFREFGLTAEIDVQLLDPTYTGEEGYWCPATMDWIIYASHESSLTVGGTLLAALKELWPDWEKYRWTGEY